MATESPDHMSDVEDDDGSDGGEDGDEFGDGSEGDNGGDDFNEDDIAEEEEEEGEEEDDDNWASRKCGSRMKNRKFRKSHVNPNLTLHDLNLENFTGCYRTDNHHQMLTNLRGICSAVKIPMKFVEHDDNAGSTLNSGLYQGHVSLLMNGIRVCDGYGDHSGYARRDAVTTAYKYLQYKGLALWNPATIKAENVRFVSWDEIKGLGGDKKSFKQKFKRFVINEFLHNPDLVEMRLTAVLTPGKSKWKQKAVPAVGRDLKLKVKNDHRRNRFHMYKVNCFIHMLNACPVPEQLLEAEGQSDAENQEVDKPGPARRRQFKTKLTFNPTLTNGELTGLKCLNLHQYHAVLLRSALTEDIVTDMAKSAGVPCQFRLEGPFRGKQYTRFHALLHMNRIYVAKGYGKDEKEAKSSCSSNVLLFLMSKGLRVVYEDQIHGQQVKKVLSTDLQSLNVEEHFSNFLVEKKFLKMKFCFEASDEERELIETSCNTHSLVLRTEESGKLIVMKSSNLSGHQLEVLLPGEGSAVPTFASSSKMIEITEEDLSANSSLCHHVQKFVEDDTLSKLQFPESLGETERELCEALSEKHKLTYSLDDNGKVFLTKGSQFVSIRIPTKNLLPQPKDEGALQRKEQKKIRVKEAKKEKAERYRSNGRKRGPSAKKRPPKWAKNKEEKKRRAARARDQASHYSSIPQIYETQSESQQKLLMSHFVPPVETNDNRPALLNTPSSSGNFNENLQRTVSTTHRLSQNRSSYDGFKGPGHQRGHVNQQAPDPYNQNRYGHGSHQDYYQNDEYGSYEKYGSSTGHEAYDAVQTSHQDQYQSISNQYRSYSDQYQSNSDRYQSNSDRYQSNSDQYRSYSDHYQSNSDHYQSNSDRYQSSSDQYQSHTRYQSDSNFAEGPRDWRAQKKRRF